MIKMSFMCTCVDWPYTLTKLQRILRNGKKISRTTFIKNCFVDDKTLQNMRQYPHDYEYYKFKNVFWYTHSAIEYFYALSVKGV